MSLWRRNTYTRSELTALPAPNYWDWIAICLVFALIFLLAWGSMQMTAPYHIGEAIPISLQPSHLPYYALRTVLRMFIAMFFSIIFTFIFGTWAAKSKTAERIIVPAIDVLQSVPVLGFLSIAVVGFVALFPHSILGPECAAIFAIFTAQVWNIVLSFYQSLKIIPKEMREATSMFHLSAWQLFWRVEVPFAMPGLLWNVMMSMSASWFFVVASEAISVAHQNIRLPGVGSYIFMAVLEADKAAIIYAIIAMLVVILLYDQLIFRPLIHWAQKFKLQLLDDEEEKESWVVNFFQKTRLVRASTKLFNVAWDGFVNLSPFNTPRSHTKSFTKKATRSWTVFTNVIMLLSSLAALLVLSHFIFAEVSVKEVPHVFYLGFITGLRVMVLIFLSCLVWIPVGVWIGLRPRIAEIVQPIIQFLAAFPVNLIYPIAVILIVNYHLNVNVWCSPLIILGTQWYILFNVIAGVSTVPSELRFAATNFELRGWLWWRRLMLPGIFPFCVTGAITAAGGAWNASILAEFLVWGHTKLIATGLGAYITVNTQQGNFPRLVLGIAVMCVYVLVINRLLWRPLYKMAADKFSI